VQGEKVGVMINAERELNPKATRSSLSGWVEKDECNVVESVLIFAVQVVAKVSCIGLKEHNK
jgi:hypothetical protein